MKRPLVALLVENDLADAELNLYALREAGFEVSADVVSTPEEFTERLSARSYDVVLADFRLSNWTGMEALETLRSLGYDTPLILVTGTLGDERAVDCVRRGAADYVLKDNLTRLPVAVIRALDEHRARVNHQRADERMRDAQKELRERDARFTQLADSISEVFYLVDAQFRETLFINRAFETIWGRSRQSAYDNPKAFFEAVLPEDQSRLGAYIDQVLAGKDAGEVEFRIARPNGEIRWVLAHAVPIRNEAGTVYRLSGVTLDITERREAQRALEDSEERFRKLIDASFDAIDITQEGVILEVNRGFLETFGYDSFEEVVGRHVADFSAPESVNLIQQRIANQEEGMYEIVGIRKDGTRITLEVTARNQTIGGRPGRVAALRDVTQQRSLEEQFRQAQKMEAMGRLAGGVAHDFNNLLTVIGGYAELLAGGMGASDPRRAELDEIRKASTAAATLTRQLLAFSRQQVIQPQLLALGDVVANTENMLRRVVGEDVSVATSLSPAPLMVKCDPGQIEHVLMNLAVNARDAMPTGGQLTIETAAVDLDDAYAQAHWPATPGRFAMLAVSDTGIGMDQATQARIFEPFFTTKEVGKGTGLGLATVYGIVKQNGGFIWVYSEPGHGATFKIYLPIASEAPTTASHVSTAPVVPRGSETILVTEDSRAVRATVRDSLTRLGYIVIEAASARAALDLATSQEHIDLLLTDVVMPGMSGRELAEEFSKLRPGVKVIYMSGYTDDAVLRHGILSSGVAFLQKPFTPESLARKMRDVLDETR